MKKALSFYVLLVVMMTMMVIVAYTTGLKQQPVAVSQKVQVVKPEFFYFVTDIVKKGGDPLWTRSIQEYGTGYDWTNWVAKNPFLQEEGRTWQNPITDQWYALIRPGEILVNPNPRYVNPIFRDTIKTPVVNIGTASTDKKVSRVWAYLSMAFGLYSLFLIFFFLRSQKFRKEDKENYKKRIEALQEQNHRLRKQDFETISSLIKRTEEKDDQIEELRNQLPIKAPEKVTDEWLKNNYPIAEPISDVYMIGYLINNPAMGERGVMPDIVVKASASTKPEAVIMGFSHDREALLGLDKVTVFIGWNWNKKTRKWNEVGMVAGFCQNQFVSNPDKIRKMSELFTNFELAGDKHPIVHQNPDATKNHQLPALVKKLIVKFHSSAITELQNNGVTVEIPKSLQ